MKAASGRGLLFLSFRYWIGTLTLRTYVSIGRNIVRNTHSYLKSSHKKCRSGSININTKNIKVMSSYARISIILREL